MNNNQKNQENIDLFEFYDQQPADLLKVTDKWGEKMAIDGLDYEDCKKFLEEVQQLGYTFEYGLDAEPYGLRPLTKNELEIFSKNIESEHLIAVINAFEINDTQKGIELLSDLKNSGKELSGLEINQIMNSNISIENKAITLSMLNIERPEKILFPGTKTNENRVSNNENGHEKDKLQIKGKSL